MTTTPPNPSTPAPTKWSDLDEYIKPAHLQGAIVPVTIDHIEFRKLHPRPGVEETKPVAFFAGKKKSLILTATNQDYLQKTFGDDITASYGKPVTIHAVTKRVAGKDIETIIIRVAE